MEQLETLTVEQSGGVATVTLNRPAKKNAMSRQSWDDLRSVLDRVADDSTVRALVLTGAGGDFCSGADLSGAADDDAQRLPTVTSMRHIADAVLRLYRLPKPTLAKVDGVAVGIGLSMALACDLVVASERARFAEIFVRRGLAVDGGSSWLLPRIVGLQKAKELAFFGDIIGAADAERLGLVNRVVATDELDKTAEEWAARLAAGPTIALSLTKTMLNNSFATSFDQALEDESRSQHVTFATADTAEAMEAFLAKRDPRFRGR